MAIFTVAVEEVSDVPVVQKLLTSTGHELGFIYSQRGKASLDQNLAGYNNAAKHTPWIVVRDLDRDAPCAGLLVARLLPNPSTKMLFRIAVREIEAWLLADTTAIARFLQVPLRRIPNEPDSLESPKLTLLKLAHESKQRAIRDDMVRLERSHRKIGPAYVSRIAEFAREHWRPEVALNQSDSLRRCFVRLQHWRS